MFAQLSAAVAGISAQLGEASPLDASAMPADMIGFESPFSPAMSRQPFKEFNSKRSFTVSAIFRAPPSFYNVFHIIIQIFSGKLIGKIPKESEINHIYT